MEALSFQHLMDQLGELSGSQRQVLSEAIALGGSGEELLEMINTRFKAAPVCGHCGSTQVRKWGKASGLKRYLCQKCRRTFNALTGTPLAQLHRRDAWFEYAKALCDGVSLREAARRSKVDLTTSFRWRHRFLQAQKEAQPEQLQGIVEADEAFFFKICQGISKTDRSSAPKTRRQGEKTRTVS